LRCRSQGRRGRTRADAPESDDAWADSFGRGEGGWFKKVGRLTSRFADPIADRRGTKIARVALARLDGPIGSSQPETHDAAVLVVGHQELVVQDDYPVRVVELAILPALAAEGGQVPTLTVEDLQAVAANLGHEDLPGPPF
jgi:hypothetical protein